MEFGKSVTKLDRPHAESCPNVRRNADPPKLPALFPNCMCRQFRRPLGHDSAGGLSKLVALLPNSMQIVHDWSEKGVRMW